MFWIRSGQVIIMDYFTRVRQNHLYLEIDMTQRRACYSHEDLSRNHLVSVVVLLLAVGHKMMKSSRI